MCTKFYELINGCFRMLGVKYLYGFKYELVTNERINKLASMYPNIYTQTYINKAKTFIGERAIDCSGLISNFTGVTRGSTKFMETATERYSLNSGAEYDFERFIGCALWRNGHIGVIVSKDYLIEAKGIDYGVKLTKIVPSEWTLLLKLGDVNYTETGIYKLNINKDEFVHRLRKGEADCDGFTEFSGRTYYLENKVLQCSRWLRYGEHWYYLWEDGAVATNQWIRYNNKWFYLDNVGHMVADGFYKVGEFKPFEWYYFNQSGELVYTFNNSEILIKE